MGIRPEAWGAAHTLDSGSPACAQSLHIDVYMPPPPPPLSIYFVCLFFFWEETEFILNIIYLCI